MGVLLSFSTTLSESIANEILTQGPLEVGLKNDDTVTVIAESESIVSVKTAPIDLPVNKDDVVLITGGARGVTAEVAYQMAQQWQAELHLLGRNPIEEQEAEWSAGIEDEAQLKQAIAKHYPKIRPNELQQQYQALISQREVRSNLERIRSTGVKCEYHSVDVRDAEAMQSQIKSIKKTSGSIKGLIHAAGVLADKLIVDKTQEQFNQVYSTKVDGMNNLLAATKEEPLKFMVLFSSTTARLGRKGQSDYAAANEVLNKTAQQLAKQKPDCRVVSVNWGPWAGGMVTPALRKVFEAEGVGLIDIEAGANYLLDEIAQPGPVEVVILGGDDASFVQSAIVHQVSDNEDFHLTFDRIIGVDEYPFLQSHVMNGKAVLPVAMMIEWLAHGAMHDNPGMQFHGIGNFRMFKGVTLSAGQQYDLQIMAGNVSQKGDAEVIPMELRSGEVLHAAANVILKSDYETQPLANLKPVEGDYPYSGKEIYAEGRLFHGKALQGLKSISACSEAGITAKVMSSPKPAEWMRKPIRSAWLTDPLILDSAFQMIILWSHQHNGSGSLPTAIENYRQFKRAFPKQGVNIVINVTEQTEHRARVAIEFLDEQGEIIALMDGYECVRDGSLNEAFLKNKIPESIKP